MSRAAVCDIIVAQDRLAGWIQHFFLCPNYWKKYRLTVPSRWQTQKLERTNANRVPETPGIYTLILQPGIAAHPACSYLMYVGKTDSLRRRFSEYLGKERRFPGRTKVVRFLNKYNKYIHFCFFPATLDALSAQEDNLIEAYLPPLNCKYKGSLSVVMGAFQ